jgi:hypothetical protein
MNVWDRVKVTINELPYAGTIIAKEDELYIVSIVGMDEVYKFQESEIETLSD